MLTVVGMFSTAIGSPDRPVFLHISLEEVNLTLYSLAKVDKAFLIQPAQKFNFFEKFNFLRGEN